MCFWLILSYKCVQSSKICSRCHVMYVEIQSPPECSLNLYIKVNIDSCLKLLLSLYKICLCICKYCMSKKRIIKNADDVCIV